jgi:hypothetical protein
MSRGYLNGVQNGQAGVQNGQRAGLSLCGYVSTGFKSAMRAASAPSRLGGCIRAFGRPLGCGETDGGSGEVGDAAPGNPILRSRWGGIDM